MRYTAAPTAVDANIQSERGILKWQTRSIQTEGHFGDIKENENFRRFLNEKLKKFEGKTPKKQLDQKCGCKNPDKGFLRPKINFIFHRKKDPTQGGRLTSLVLAGILSIATEDAEM